MNTQSYDLICSGGGPANLAMAEEIALRSSMRVLVVDIGLGIRNRFCPLSAASPCPPCKTCHAVHGIAGAGAYSDGKLSFWPAGSGLLGLAGSIEDVLALDDRLRIYFEPLLANASSATTCKDAATLDSKAATKGINLKAYDVFHCGSEAIQEFYHSKYQQLVQMGVTFATRSKVIEIVPEGSGAYRVTWVRAGKTQSAVAPMVSLGVGKAFGVWLRKILDELEVERTQTTIEPGIRLELPYQLTEHIANCHRDAKFKINCCDGSEVRSFCFCYRGFVLGAYYDDMTTVSGFSLRDRHSNNTNFAVLNRIKIDSSDPYQAVLPYIKAQNTHANGGVTVQLLGDFRRDVPSSSDSIANACIQPTLGTAVPGRLVLGPYDGIRKNLIEFIECLDKLMPGVANPRNLVYGPVLEKSWDEVKLDKMRTTARGVFVVGDATGHARGLVQAVGTGILAAQTILAT